MAPAGAQPQQKTTGTNGPTVQRKKFQVVPVPGEFTRGRWKCVDTRGLSNGEFGNYPADDEYKTMVSLKNNMITVRKKFFRRTPEAEKKEKEKKEEPISHIQVVSSGPRIDSDSDSGRRDRSNYVEVRIMPTQPQPQPVLVQPTPVQVQPPPLSSSTVILSSHTHITPNPAVLTSSPTHVAPPPMVTPKTEDEGYRTSKLATSTSNTVVAIDNKIVQAMDLVKTHLTFAVREEVETLRSTISDLENRLAALREENRILRENASPEVLAFINANNNICKCKSIFIQKVFSGK